MLGRLILFGLTWTLLHHALGGIRHLILDAGRAHDYPWREYLARASVVGSVALTILVWIIGYIVWSEVGDARIQNVARPGSRSRLGEVRHEQLWRQRLTAIIGLPLAVVFSRSCTGLDSIMPPRRLSDPRDKVVLLLTIVHTFVHMRLGMQVIIEDYVRATLAKTGLLMANTGFTAALGIAGAFAALQISFGN